jgi:outer membrane receptor protein involved in Fe transport
MASASALALAAPAFAADAPKSENTVQEVIVTANKVEEKLHDVAQAVTAVGGGDMQVRQDLDFHDFASQVPGFNLQQLSPGFNREILRGQNSGSPGATVATLIDEMPLSFSGSDSNAAFTSTNLGTYDLQRIEVLKGPQGTLYGATAEGGVIKFVTNAPDLHHMAGGLDTSVFDVAHGQTAAAIKGFVNAPFWDDKAALRITANDETIPGYINNPYLGQHNVNGGFRYGGRVQFLFQPTEDLSVRLMALNQTAYFRGDGLVNVVGNPFYNNGRPPLGPFFPINTSTTNQYNLQNGFSHDTYIPDWVKNTINDYSMTLNWDLHWANLTSVTSYGTLKNTYNEDLSFGEYAPGITLSEIYGAIFYGQPIVIRQRQTEGIQKATQEVRLASDPGSKLFDHDFDWIVGMFATREVVTFNQVFDAMSLPSAPTPLQVLSPAFGGAHLPSAYDEQALFGQVDYHFTPSIDVAVGARISHDTEVTQTHTFCCLLEGPTALLPHVGSVESPSTWSVAPRWKIDENNLVYARVATGFRPGGPNLLIPGAPPDFPRLYGPDSTTNYEVGYRTDLFDKTFSIDVSAFYITWKNIQILTSFTSTTTHQTFNVDGNAGNAVSQGLEWNFGWRPISHLRFDVIGAWTDAHLTTSAPALGALSGQKLPYVPGLSNTVDVDYDWPAFGDYDYFVGGSWVYMGQRYSDFGALAFGETHVNLPAYDTLSLQLGLRDNAYTFEFYAKNLSDTRGISTFGNGGGMNTKTGMPTGTAVLIEPRTLGFRFATSFF